MRPAWRAADFDTPDVQHGGVTSSRIGGGKRVRILGAPRGVLFEPPAQVLAQERIARVTADGFLIPGGAKEPPLAGQMLSDCPELAGI